MQAENVYENGTTDNDYVILGGIIGGALFGGFLLGVYGALMGAVVGFAIGLWVWWERRMEA